MHRVPAKQDAKPPRKRLAELLRRVANRLDAMPPRAKSGARPASDAQHSPDIRLLSRSEVKELIQEFRRERGGGLRFLDVGGRHGEFQPFAEGFEYVALEIDQSARAPGVMIGDICHCPEIESASFDVVFSNNVFEHLREPWAAAAECVRLARPGGLIAQIAPFSWRYHPFPIDFYRFSHDGLRYLFERTGEVETVLCGYDISKRRVDSRGGKVAGNRDVPPIDELGGWRENWLTLYVGRKRQPSQV